MFRDKLAHERLTITQAELRNTREHLQNQLYMLYKILDLKYEYSKGTPAQWTLTKEKKNAIRKSRAQKESRSFNSR